jgi:hypothetical protein
MKEKREWQNNAFWVDINKKNSIEAILMVTTTEGKKIKQQLVVNEKDKTGQPNTDFIEILEVVTPERIDENTKKRTVRKTREKEIEKEKRRSKEQAKELSDLFNLKIKTLEVDVIKESDNRDLKSKLRRAKTAVEMQAYANIIVMEHLGYITKPKTAPKKKATVKKTPKSKASTKKN